MEQWEIENLGMTIAVIRLQYPYESVNMHCRKFQSMSEVGPIET